MPRCKISLIRRMRAEKAGTGLLRQAGVYGFDTGDVELSGPDGPPSNISCHRPNLHFMSVIYEAMKRRLQFF
uniref:Uncharacterized protein n=1 Tax=Caenorhabditis japonica TaxID=281687 RepID=A0A8R1ICK0_CAEJA